MTQTSGRDAPANGPGDRLQVEDSRRLARALLRQPVLGHPVPAPELIETHISIVALSGDYAYKLRKPVQLPFLDFRTLAARREDCESELALNRRWAPELYLEVVAIGGRVDAPRLGGSPVLDYAVKMRQFPHAARLDRVAAAGGLDAALVEALALCVAEMHRQAPPAAAGSPHGGARAIRAQVEGNFHALRGHALFPGMGEQLAALEQWSDAALGELDATFARRLAGGLVRDCHGDLHLANLVRLGQRVVPFDGVEFEEDFRVIDVISDLAFLLMDLRHEGLVVQAGALLDGYLQRTGDYTGLRVLRHYLVYRAMVRAKVALLRLQQIPRSSPEALRSLAQLRSYLDLAEQLRARPSMPRLLITFGLSGSGKSWLTHRLAPLLGALCIRSDVERARLYPQAAGRYAADASDRTYEQLAGHARAALGAGYPAILDATFLEARRRDAAVALAGELGVPLRILALDAPRAVLEARIRERMREGSDASEADLQVLAGQIAHVQGLRPAEERVCVHVSAGEAVDLQDLAQRLLAD